MLAAAIVALAASRVAAFDAQVGWTPVQSVAGYRLYVRQNGQVYGAGLDLGLLQAGTDGVVRYVDRGLPTGVVNYVAVTAYDGSGRESAPSNELSVLVANTPAATLTPSASATRSRTPTPTAPPTASAVATATQAPQPSNTAVATPTRSASATATRAAPTGSATPTPTPTPTPAILWVVSIPTDAHAKPGIAVSVPIRITAGSNIRQLAAEVAFDPGVVAVQGVQLSTTAGAGSVAADFATPGALRVSAALAQPMTAGGPLVNVFFTAVGACRSATVLQITSCVLDGGAAGCQPSDGRIAVRCNRRSS
jgi:hypothetical protein